MFTWKYITLWSVGLTSRLPVLRTAAFVSKTLSNPFLKPCKQMALFSRGSEFYILYAFYRSPACLYHRCQGRWIRIRLQNPYGKDQMSIDKTSCQILDDSMQSIPQTGEEPTDCILISSGPGELEIERLPKFTYVRSFASIFN